MNSLFQNLLNLFFFVLYVYKLSGKVHAFLTYVSLTKEEIKIILEINTTRYAALQNVIIFQIVGN